MVMVRHCGPKFGGEATRDWDILATMSSRIPVTLLPPKGSARKKHRGHLWLRAEKVQIEYRPRFSLPGKPTALWVLPFDDLRRAAYDRGLLGDRLLLELESADAMGDLPTVDRRELRVLMAVDKDDREVAELSLIHI